MRALMMSLFTNNRLKTDGQYSKAVRIPLNTFTSEYLLPYICPDFGGALFNFRQILKLGAPWGWGPGQVPPALPHLAAPCVPKV